MTIDAIKYCDSVTKKKEKQELKLITDTQHS